MVHCAEDILDKTSRKCIGRSSGCGYATQTKSGKTSNGARIGDDMARAVVA